MSNPYLALERQARMFDAEAFGDMPVHCIGVGGAGSKIVHLLAMHGVKNIHAWDGDCVEEHNVHNQFYPPDCVGMKKVDALDREIHRWTGTSIEVHPEHVTGAVAFPGIVFLCVDDNDTKRDIYEQSILGNQKVSLMIDTRMDMTFTTVYSAIPANAQHREYWEHFCHPQKDAQDEGLACGSRMSAAVTSTRIATDAVLSLFRWFAHQQGKPGPFWAMVSYNLRTCEQRHQELPWDEEG